MDFEKTVGNLEPKRFKETLDDSDTMDKSEDKFFGQRAKIKSDRNEDDYDHRFKRSRSSDESHDHKKEKSLRSCRHSPSRDRERAEKDNQRRSREFSDRDKDRDEENGSRKENDRYKVKHRERGRDKDRNTDKTGHAREYGRQRDREREQERSHRRSSYTERHEEEQVRERSRERETSHDVEYRERERERDSRERDRGNKRIIEKKEEMAEPEADAERDQRTVFAYQISVRADDRDVYEFFSRAGKVRDVRLIIDHNSRCSKGFGYIEFYDAMSVPTALALSGHPLLGQPVMVKPSEAEKNLVQFTSSAAGAIGLMGPYSEGARRLHVGNLDSSINKNQLRQVFEPFGLVELVQLPCDPESGHSKGYGFVQFARIEDARAAQSLDGQLKIAGQVMKVSAVPDQSGGQEVGDSGGDFDDDEGGDLSVSAQSRTLLTHKLDSTRTSSRFDTRNIGAPIINSPGLNIPATQVVCTTSAIAPFGQIPVPALAGFSTAGLSIPAAIVPSIDNIGTASECLLLKNMFDPKVESEPNFDQDIREDVEDQCSKFGKLKHIYVDKYSAGFVYLRFENTQSSITAQHALHGRWFAGKMITATYMVPQNYEAKFSESKQDISA